MLGLVADAEELLSGIVRNQDLVRQERAPRSVHHAAQQVTDADYRVADSDVNSPRPTEQICEINAESLKTACQRQRFLMSV